MVRTQIQLTEDQAQRLRLLAARRAVSVAELIRQSVERFLQEQTALDEWEEKKRLARLAVGKFHSGVPDLATNHDYYLALAIDSYPRLTNEETPLDPKLPEPVVAA